MTAAVRAMAEQLDRRAASQRQELMARLEAAQRAGRQDMTPDEVRAMADYRATQERADEAIAEMRRCGDPRALARFNSPRTGTTMDYDLTYRRGDRQTSWVKDLVKNAIGQDPTGESRSRLMRHAEEVARSPGFQEHRDLSRVDGEGGYFSPPAWLIDQYADFARPGRAFANLVQRQPLPGGTDSINVPKILSGTATAIQTADLQPVTEVDMTDTFINAPVRTVAGQQGIAVQLLDQSPIAMDDVIFRDLVSAYAVNVDLQALYGTGSSGQVLGVNLWPNILTVAVSALTIGGIYNALANAIQKILTTRFMPPTAIVMHPRRWAWLTSLLDENNRPLFIPQAGGPWAAAGVLTDVAPEGIVGQVLGLPVVVDANVATSAGSETPTGTEDEIIVLRAEDVVLYESGVRGRVLPETRASTLSVLVQVYGYIALAVRYPGSVCTITGLTPPSF